MTFGSPPISRKPSSTDAAWTAGDDSRRCHRHGITAATSTGCPAASGEKYSLLPPENATGNYVKVVQRLPVRIRFNARPGSGHRLRPGMSVEPTVWLQMSAAPDLRGSPRLNAPPARRAQPVGDRADRDAGHVHGGARHQYRQRRVAAYRRRPVGQHPREHLGAHLLPGRQRDRAAAQRLDRGSDRAQALLHDLRRAVHDQLVAVRAGAFAWDPDSVPRPAGRGRRRTCSRASSRSWPTLSRPKNWGWRSRSMAWRWCWRRRSARRWAATSPTISTGAGFSSSMFRSASRRSCSPSGWSRIRPTSSARWRRRAARVSTFRGSD